LVRAAGSLEASSLDLGARHLLAQKGLSTEKQLVVIALCILAASQTAKAVEIQLTLKGSQLALTKVSAQ